MAEANLYLPTVAWRTSISNVILLTEETTELVATYRVTVDPIDINEPGGLTGEAEDIDANNYYLKDFLGHTFKIIDVGTGTVDISDDFRTGHGAVTGRMGIIYKSVGGGTSPYLAPVYYKYLDKSARDYSRRFELDILWKNAGIQSIGSEVDPTYPISYIYYIDQYGDKIYVTEVPKPNGLIWGGNVSWVELLKFDVTKALYYLEGILFKTDATQVTLAPADPTLDRIDIIVADDQEVISVITGVPSASPQKPTIDVTTQVELTYVLVQAGATVPYPLPTDEVIYNENVEWTVSSSGVTVNADYTTEHYQGAKSIDVPAIGNADYIHFDSVTTLDKNDYDNIVMNIKLKATMDTRKMYISVVFLLDGVAVNNPVKFLIDGTLLDWQNSLITLSRINFFSPLFNEVRFYFYRVMGGDFTGFYLDYIKLQKGVVQPPIVDEDNYVNSAIWDAGTDTLTLKRTGGLSDVKVTIPCCDPVDVIGGATYPDIKYGALYNWWAANDARNIAPVGWHIPTDAEYVILREYLDPLGNYIENIAGTKLKETGLTHWQTGGGTNDVGFNARGSGVRNDQGLYTGLTIGIYLWNSTPYPYNQVDGYHGFIYDGTTWFRIGLTSTSKKSGSSIRLLKDDSVDTGTMVGNDGKVYPTVTIGTQVWMAANLAETKYRNGDLISNHGETYADKYTNAEWAALTTEAMCWYDDNPDNGYTDVAVIQHNLLGGLQGGSTTERYHLTKGLYDIYSNFVQDISFDFNDVEAGIVQTWILDIKASFAYKILSVVLQSDSTMDDVTVEIAGSPITWADDSVSIDVTTAVSDTAAKTDEDNDVAVGEQVTLVKSATDGYPMLIRGKLRIQRT